jgi:hypothetical protein
MGRHSHPEEDSDAELAQEDGQLASAEKTSAVADLQLVLHNPRLLIACALAVVVPLIGYFVTMTVLDKMHDWPLFVGVPLVLAGVLVGALLDHAYAQLPAAKAVVVAAKAELANAESAKANAESAELAETTAPAAQAASDDIKARAFAAPAAPGLRSAEGADR